MDLEDFNATAERAGIVTEFGKSTYDAILGWRTVRSVDRQLGHVVMASMLDDVPLRALPFAIFLSHSAKTVEREEGALYLHDAYRVDRIRGLEVWTRLLIDDAELVYEEAQSELARGIDEKLFRPNDAVVLLRRAGVDTPAGLVRT